MTCTRRTSAPLATFLVIALVLMPGCSPRKDQATEGLHPETLRIAEQFGLAYSPLVIAREMGLLEDALPGVRIEWVQLQNAAAIREAMVAGRLDVGFMGIPPFLIGADRGMEWRIFTGLSQAPLMLVTNRAGVRDLADLTEVDRIALPQPGSIQHILLALAAERELESAGRFDSQLVSLSHPDALAALTNNRTGITAYFGSPPYVQEAVDRGATPVLTGRQAFGGPFTFIVGVAEGEFAGTHPATLRAIAGAIRSAASNLSGDRELEALASRFDLTEDRVEELLAIDGLVFSTEVHGVERFTEFMHRAGYLNRLLDPADLTASAGAEGGSTGPGP